MKYTKPEEITQEILLELGCPVHPEIRLGNSDSSFYFQYRFMGMIIDFANPVLKIAIEVDGDHWHGNGKQKLSTKQLQAKQRDNEKDKILKEAGWNVIRVWESDLINNRQHAKDHIHTSYLNTFSV